MPAAWLDSLRIALGSHASPTALLGALISAPPLAPYTLMRRVRRAFFGRGTLYLEAMLCHGELVEAVSIDGIELDTDFRTMARTALRAAILSGEIPAAELRAVNHCDDLAMSPLLRVEEQLVWAYLSRADPTEECNRLLADCLLTIVRYDRKAILDWAVGALWRLPDLVLSTQAAWILSQLCLALGRDAPILPAPGDKLSLGLLREVLPLIPSKLVGFSRDGTSLTLGPISRSRRTAFAVPSIAIQPVTVSWPDETDSAREGAEHTITIDVAEGVHELMTGSSAVRLENIAGRTVTLPAFQSSGIPPELRELDRSLDILESAWTEGRPVLAQLVRQVSASGVIVRFPDARMLTGYLRLESGHFDQFGGQLPDLIGQELEVRISNFERTRQRIMCRPVQPPTWSAGTLTAGLWVEGQVENVVAYGMFIRVPTTERGLSGPYIIGLAHNSEYPPEWASRAPWMAGEERQRVRVLNIDKAARRVSLSMRKDPQPDPQAHPEGSVVRGVVSTIVNFGAFVTLPSGADGLLHNSELRPDQQLAVGDELRVRITQIDADRRRISLATVPPLPVGHRSLGDVLREARLAAKEDIPKPAPGAGEVNVEAVTDFLLETIRMLSAPIPLATLAGVVKDRFGAEITEDWLGFGGFMRMLLALVPGVTIDKERAQYVHPGTV